MPKKLTTDDFVTRSKEIHGDFYDYTLSEYTSIDKKLVIICPQHGRFNQTPYHHTSRKQGCKICANKQHSIRQRMSVDEFISRAAIIHENVYTYENVVYLNDATKVEISCTTHGPFMQTPNAHLQGQGCRKCGYQKLSLSKTYSTQDFIGKAMEIHRHLYDYSNVQYVGSEEKVIIICTEHGFFEQAPASHLSGQGCPKCGVIQSAGSKRSSTKKFIASAKIAHGDYYDYSSVTYQTNYIKVSIICPEHGVFHQTPMSHLAGSGCMPCGLGRLSIHKTYSLDDFINLAKKVHKDRYDYSFSDYQGGHNLIEIICAEHGSFKQTASSHLQGIGCPSCAGNKKLGIDQFVNRSREIHGSRYDYDKAVYLNSDTDIEISCQIHGSFYQRPSAHLSGSGCSRCYNKREGELAVLLNQRTITHREFSIGSKRYDFYLPSFNLLIERDGEQHYPMVWNRSTSTIFNSRGREFADQHLNDRNKSELAKSHGFLICRIPYWLSVSDVELELDNILNGNPSYPDIPNRDQEIDKPRPKGYG